MGNVYLEIAPGPRLSRYVECYWWGEQRAAATKKIFPDGCADILFAKMNGEPAALNFVGLMTTPMPCELEAGRAFFGVRFRPGMAAAFVREAALLNNRIEPMESMWGTRARAMFARLADAANAREMAATMDGLLRPSEPPDSVQSALWRLCSTAAPLDRLLSDSGISARHFRRACVERAGVPPQYLRRILRFRKAVERIGAAEPDWARFAADCGYYDQAHLIREFREFAGSTPARFVQSRLVAAA